MSSEAQGVGGCEEQSPLSPGDSIPAAAGRSYNAAIEFSSCTEPEVILSGTKRPASDLSLGKEGGSVPPPRKLFRLLEEIESRDRAIVAAHKEIERIKSEIEIVAEEKTQLERELEEAKKKAQLKPAFLGIDDGEDSQIKALTKIKHASVVADHDENSEFKAPKIILALLAFL